MEVYEPGQISNIYPFINFDPGWFLLGGPADATEAQDMRKRFPNVCIIGFEPNPLFYSIQAARGFPGRLLPVALWGERTELEIKRVSHQLGFWMEHRSGSALKFNDVGTARTICIAEAYPLDLLDEMYGPFENAVLWIDIEEAETQCLRGASKLLGEGRIRLINAVLHAEDLGPVLDILEPFGVKEISRWNSNVVILPDGGRREWWNVVFRLNK